MSNAADEVRVMVVDDVADSAEVLALVLQMDGYTVRAANSAEAALEIVNEFEPLCVLLDINMPGMGGHGLARQLRSLYGGGIVLIAVTGEGRLDDRISDSFAQFDHYLRKPVDLALLKKVLPPVGPST